MSDDEDFDNNPLPLIEQVAENMAIYARRKDGKVFMPQAKQLLRSFEAIEGRPAVNYMEVEKWSRRHLDVKGAKFLVLPGGKPGD